jgi:hypothetical protein
LKCSPFSRSKSKGHQAKCLMYANEHTAMSSILPGPTDE